MPTQPYQMVLRLRARFESNLLAEYKPKRRSLGAEGGRGVQPHVQLQSASK